MAELVGTFMGKPIKVERERCVVCGSGPTSAVLIVTEQGTTRVEGDAAEFVWWLYEQAKWQQAAGREAPVPQFTLERL